MYITLFPLKKQKKRKKYGSSDDEEEKKASAWWWDLRHIEGIFRNGFIDINLSVNLNNNYNDSSETRSRYGAYEQCFLLDRRRTATTAATTTRSDPKFDRYRWWS
jgi:hypothetical protein